MKKLREEMIAHLAEHPIDFGCSDVDTVTEFLYDAYCEARQEEPAEIRELAKQLSPYLERVRGQRIMPCLGLSFECVLPMSGTLSRKASGWA